MKTLIAVAGLLAIGVTAASAQYAPWKRDQFPYQARHHGVCQQKAHRLHDYERRAARDGRVDRGERAIIRSLQRDLDMTCGRYRWRG